MIHIVYHAKCNDGFGAAYAAWKFFGDDGVKYYPASYQQDFPEMETEKGDALYILDFSYNIETLKELEEIHQFGQIVLIDHHDTAAKELLDYKGKYDWLFLFIDMEKSGALLTWEFFHPEIDVPDLIKHISDRDLWNFELEGTKEIHVALGLHLMDFKVWDKLNVDELAVKGAALVEYRDKKVSTICDNAFTATILNHHNVPVVNTSLYWSEVGQELINRNPDAPFVATFTEMKDHTMLSLRSEGDFNVGALAKTYGGGGHKNAAGFKDLKTTERAWPT